MTRRPLPLKKLSMAAALLGFSLLIILLGFSLLSTPAITNVSVDNAATPSTTSAKSSSQCHMTVHNNDRSLQDIVQRYQKVFEAVCPLLVERFGDRPDIAKNVQVTFEDINVPAYASGGAIFFATDWLRQKPKNLVGVFIHEFTHIVQDYSSDAPSWFTEGMATYADSVYSPEGEPPAFPNRAGDSYTEGYGTTARFLHWLEQNTTSTLVNQLNRALQTKQSFSAVFQRLTGGTVDDLWDQYKANPQLKPIQRIPIQI